jgi:hypothetical protein
MPEDGGWEVREMTVRVRTAGERKQPNLVIETAMTSEY